jgi:nicotinamidase-related amidase
MLLNAKNSCLLLIDVQEKLTPFIYKSEELIKNCRWMLQVAARLNIPALASEQYPSGLKPTLKELSDLVPTENFMEKVHFSCTADKDCLAKINLLEKSQIVLIGIEAHVCVLQTAIGLHAANKQVFIVADAVGSRNPYDAELAFARMRQLGIQVISKEMAFFEWVHQAGTAEYKQLSQDFLKS